MTKKKRVDLTKLYKAILSLKSEDECEAFLDDICTIQELEALSQRLEVAKLLARGESYIDINKKTGASTATIGRVSKALNYGAGGYQLVLSDKENGDAGN